MYEICADEAWTHQSLPLNRYWNFYGGVFGEERELDRLETDLRGIRTRYGHHREMKWTALQQGNLAMYKALVDCLLGAVDAGRLTYRQFFTSREHIWVPDDSAAPNPSALDVQFKLYYQFLKHSFGLRFLPRRGTLLAPTRILVRLDDHSSQKHKADLRSFAQHLPGSLARHDLRVQVAFVRSGSSVRLQVCDVLMGAAGSYGNKQHDAREPGQHGRTPKQKLRYEMARHIYDRIRDISNRERGAKAFNWFESTGSVRGSAAQLTQKVKIWKFIPNRYRLDRGWQNDHLDKHGNYMAPDIDPVVRTASGQ